MEIRIKESCLVVHRNGTIERRDLRNNKLKTVQPTKNKQGYLCIRADWKKVPIHRLMAMVYLGMPLNDITREIVHINHNLTDNRVDNIKLV